MNENIVIPIAGIIMIVVLSIGVPMVRAIVRSMDAQSKQPAFPSDIADRLERMERSLDAVAVEVERISEGQRFTTKLLSDNSRGDQRVAAQRDPVAGQPS